MKIICFVSLFSGIVCGYQLLVSEPKILFFFLLLSDIILLWHFIFYERNLNYVFTCKNDKLFVNTAFKKYVFYIDKVYIKSGGIGINSYFFVCDSSLNKKIKFYCLHFGTKKFAILKEKLLKAAM